MARQKMTDGEGELPDISAPELEFCRLIIEADMPASEAYRQAIDASGTTSSIWNAASRLRATDRCQRWTAYLRWQAGKGARCTLEDHMRELERLRNAAEASGNMGAAVQAEQLRGKVAGHHIERYKDESERLDDSALVESIAAILGEEVAQFAAEKLGIERDKPESPQHSREALESESRTIQ